VADRAIFLRTVSGDIGTVTASREGNFERSQRVAIFLRPEKGEALQLEMNRGLAAAAWSLAYRLVHSASSFAQ
jgi:hypothetical protein